MDTDVGERFIDGKIALTDFLFYFRSNTKIIDATYLKREGKKVYGSKKIKNYITGSYETLQDVLFTTEQYEGLLFISDFTIINHTKRHRTKPKEIVKAIKEGKIRRGDWVIIDGGLKSGEIMREARKAGVKVITRLNSNFVVLRFGDKIRKEDVLRVIKPIKRTINGENYIVYPIKRCIWQRTAGNLFLVKGEGYDDFIPLFTTSLNSKPETIIKKYKGRTQIEQANKELKSYLEIEGNYFKKKERNYGYIFLLSIVHNFIQYLRLYLKDKSFKEVFEELSFYLLWKEPPKCVYQFEKEIESVFGNISSEGSNKIKTWLERTMNISGEVIA